MLYQKRSSILSRCFFKPTTPRILGDTPAGPPAPVQDLPLELESLDLPHGPPASGPVPDSSKSDLSIASPIVKRDVKQLEENAEDSPNTNDQDLF